MSSLSLKIEKHIISEYNGKLPFTLGTDWVLLENPSKIDFSKKEYFLEVINNDFFKDSRLLIIGDDPLYLAVLALTKNYSDISIIITSDQLASIKNFIEENNLQIRIINSLDNSEEFDLITIQNNTENIQNINDTIVLNLNDQLKIDFPSTELEAEFLNSDSEMPLFDIFTMMTEKGLDYQILRNWEILIDGVDEYDDLTLDIYMNSDAKSYFESKLKKFDFNSTRDWIYYHIAINDELTLNIKVINGGINSIDKEVLNRITSRKLYKSGLIILKDKYLLEYLIYHGTYIIGGIDSNYFQKISELISFKYSGMYEWRTNNYGDLFKYLESKYKDSKKYLSAKGLPNYNYEPKRLVHNYLNQNNEFLRVYNLDGVQYREASRLLAQRDIFILESEEIDTKIINEEENYIIYSLKSDSKQFIKDIYTYCHNLLEDDWRESTQLQDSYLVSASKEVVILGMHRSGTSVLGSIIENMGVHIGTHILGSNDSNPNGHFEDQEFIVLNDKILKSLEASWDMLPDTIEKSEINEDLISEVEAILERKSSNGLWGWKDPRTVATLNIYKGYLKNLKLLIISRDKQDVIKSLQKRNSFSSEKAEQIYFDYNELLETIKSENNYIEIHYEDLLNNSFSEINKIANYLGVNINKDKIEELCKLIQNKPNYSNKNYEAAGLLTEVNKLIIAENFVEALEVLDKIIRISLNAAQIGNIEYLRAFCLYNLGRYEEAYLSAKNETIVNPTNDKAFELIEKIKDKIPAVEDSLNKGIDVSIIIPTFNNSIYTKNCIESIIKYTKSINYEIIIIDNNSSDNTRSILKNYKTLDNIKVVLKNENLGYAKANNQGLELATGKYILLLNNDTVLTKNWHEPLIKSALNGADICSPLLLYPGTNYIQHYYVVIGSEDGKSIAPYHIHQFHKVDEVVLINKKVNAVTGAAMFLKRDTYEKIGGLDERYVNGLEDIDYCFKAKEAGLKIETVPDSIIYHYESISDERHKYDIQNWNRLNSKWLGKIAFDEQQVDTNLNVHRIKNKKKENEEEIEKAIDSSLTNDIKNQLVNSFEKINFSIIIPVHNNLNYTKKCIESIYKSSALYAIEVIIIVNNSNDGTAEYLASLDDQISLIKNESNESYAKANNRGAENARGEYIIFLNNDIEVFPGWLEALEAKFREDRNIGIQGGKLLYPNGMIQHSGIVWGPVGKDLSLHFHIYLSANPDAPQVNKSREFQMVTGALLAIRNDLFNEIGGFDEKYHFGHEDLDLCMAVRKYGKKVWYNHDCVAVHHESITKKTLGIEKFERFIKNPESYDYKNHQYFLSKWSDFLLTDSLRYYLEDRMYGLLGDLGKFDEFEEKIKQIFFYLKDLPGDIYQEKANKISKILFGREGVDFVKDPGLILQVSMDVLEKAFETTVHKAKAKILVTMFGWDESGGGTILPKNMCKELVKMGYDVTVFYAGLKHTESNEPYYLDERVQDGVKLIGLFNRPIPFINLEKPELDIYDETVVSYFEKLVDNLKPDCIHFQNFLGLSFGIAEVAFRKGIYSSYTPYNYHLIDPALYMIESDLNKWDNTNVFENSNYLKANPELSEVYKNREEAALNLLNKWVTNIQAVSTRVKEILVEFGAKEGKITVINQISSIIGDMEIQKGNYIHTPIRFGFIGGIMPHKGVHNIIAASSALPANSCEIILYGFVSEEYKKILESIETKIRVEFKGKFNESDLLKIKDDIDVAVLPSIWEDCGPHVISECLALGLPVLAPNIGGFSDYIESGYNGYIYQYDDITALAKLMQELSIDKEKLLELKNNSYLPYDFSDYLDIVSSIYDEKPHYLDNYEIIFKNKLDKHQSINISFDTSEKDSKMVINRDQRSGQLSVGFSNNEASGKLPDNLPSPLNLNLGCGNDIREGFLNLDLFSDNPNVIKMDVRKLTFQDNSVDLILASDILEHFSHREIDHLLLEWFRVLKPEAIIIIRCPNLRLQLEAYSRGDWDADIASYMIFGGQTNPGDYHCIGFDEKSISKRLQKAGFEITTIQNEDYPQNKGFINLNMTIKAKKVNPNPEKKEIGTIIKNQLEKNPSVIDSSDFSNSKEQMNIIWEGSQFVTSSLALINREICYSIIKSEAANLTIVPYEADTFSTDGDEKLELLKSQDINYKEPIDNNTTQLPYVWIRHQWPPKADAPDGAKWVIMQPWEFTKLRPDFIDIFKKADEIWTPSNFSRNAFINSGINSDKVQVVPNGINPELFKPFGDKYKLKTKKKLKFLFIGGTILRKGVDILLNVYLSIFKAKDDVCLVIKDMGTKSYYQGQNLSEKLHDLQNNINYPEIEYIEDELSDKEMASLYRACDVFVSPYRGEGFCLPALEAMASGLPVIVTKGGATDDFVDESCGWLIPAQEEVIGTELGGSNGIADASWLIPDQKVLAFIMEDLYKNPSKIYSIGLYASFKARYYWTWRNSSLKILSRLDNLYGTSMASQALKKNKAFYDDWMELGRAEELFIERYYDEAKIIYEHILSKDIDEELNIYCLNALALISIEEENSTEAMQFLEEALDKNSNNVDSNYLKARLLYTIDSLDEALEHLNPIVEDWDRNKWQSKMALTLDYLIALSGDIIRKMGDLESALEMYKVALSHNPSNLDASFGIANCFKDNGENKQAIDILEQIVEKNPNFEEAKVLLESLGVYTGKIL